ncbi:AAA family ATPase [Janthinobacterium sp. FT14W]|uniref:XrtA-associated tyrosine autokinase n=1 Tax=Janthinobacterium sp. FT14W TaxID=2654253 RepID=UPI0012649E98|nr:XrtA-associated tyrosine autokinase [Janthinobacterium sp. FT14W]KAB8061129.1 AAA family ATPase [Janthinobacterium sp. FT14W]
MSTKDSGRQEPTILGVAEAGVPYGADHAPPQAEALNPRYRSLNLARLAEQGMLTQDGGRSSVAEDFRIIKRPLLRQARASGAEAIRHGNLIVVTSAMPGEGKTYCAINLAMSIAMEMDITVLLVDADVARPSVLKVLGLPPEPGLMDVLLDPQLAMADVILKTNVANLSILPAGRSNKHATELLASRAMSRLLAEIASRYADRVVVFDSPPLLITSEAHALVGQMGQVVMVVEAETTTQHAVKEALRQIEACEHIHLIYNKTKSFPGSDYYGYGYYD